MFAVDHYQLVPFAGATLTAHRHGDDGLLATSTPSADDGSYAMSAATGGAALDAYLAIAAPGMVPTRIELGDPIGPGYFGLALVATADEIARWYTDAGATYTADAATVIAIAVDCNRASITGATMTASTAPVYYQHGRWDPIATSSDKGFALLANAVSPEVLAPGLGGPRFPDHTVAAPAGTLTLAVASPYVQP